jgi:tetratricopeptide (TPR) repeat protein
MLFMAVIMSMSSCTLKQMIKMAQEAKPTIEPSPLELHADSVAYASSLTLPVKALKKGTSYTLEHAIKPSNGEPTKVGEMVFKQTEFANQKTDPRLTQNFSFLYNDKFEVSQLEVKGIAEKNGKSKETPVLVLNTIDKSQPNLGKGVITTSRLVQPSYEASYVAHGYVYKPEYETTSFEIYFDKGEAKLKKSELKGEQMKKMAAFLLEKKPTTITLVSSHSPEGTETINSNLARERGEVSKPYLLETLSKANIDASAVSVINKQIVFDWTPFKDAVKENKKLTDAQKTQITEIVDGAGTFESKELKLQKFGFYNSVLMRDIYPKLRVNRFEIQTIKQKITDAEIIVLGQKIAKGEESADKLTEQELSFAASKTPDLSEKEAIYSVCVKKSASASSYNNLGAVYLDMSKKTSDKDEQTALVKKAIIQFELSLKKQETPEALINIAGAKLFIGDIKGAVESLNKVQGGSSTVVATANALKGYVAITKAEYANAIQLLSAGGNDATVLYNKALAYLLKASKEMNKEDYAKAEAAFKDAIEANNANSYAYYGAAITAARLNKEADLTKNLSIAVQNSTLRARAVKDLEFVNFFEKSSFKDALK